MSSMAVELIPNPDGIVLVIGAAGVDMVGQLRGELRMGASAPSQIRSSFGGVARNVAENLARLGQPVRLISMVGSDRLGDQLIEQLQAAGVDTQGVLRHPDQPTGTYLAVVNSRGELQFALDDLRTSALLSPKEIQDFAGLFDEAAALFVDANVTKETLRTVVSLARRSHLPIIADPTSITLAEKLRPHLRKLFMVTPNVAEAEILCQLPIEASRRRQVLDAAKCLVSQGVGVVLISLARLGVCYATSETAGFVPAIQTEIVDPTGAGDALSAAVIFALLNDIPLDEAVRLGVSAAALTLAYSGAVQPDLTLEKLYDRLVI